MHLKVACSDTARGRFSRFVYPSRWVRQSRWNALIVLEFVWVTRVPRFDEAVHYHFRLTTPWRSKRRHGGRVPRFLVG